MVRMSLPGVLARTLVIDSVLCIIVIEDGVVTIQISCLVVGSCVWGQADVSAWVACKGHGRGDPAMG